MTAETKLRSRKTYDALEQAWKEKSGNSNGDTSTNVPSSRSSGDETRSVLARRRNLGQNDHNQDVYFDLQQVSFLRDFLVEGSVSAFLESWPTRPVALMEGNIEYASNLYPECIDCLRSAVEAMSLWSLSVSRAGEDVNVFNAAIRSYWRAVTKISKAVDAYNSTNILEFDQILLAIELATIFDILSKLPGVLQRVAMHWRMMCALIVRRGEAMYRTEARRRLFLDCYMGIVMSRVVLERPEPMPLPIDAIEALLKSSLTPQIPEYTVLPSVQRSYDLRGQAVSILDDAEVVDLTSVMQLKAKAEAVLGDLVLWYAGLDESRKGNQGAASLIVNICRVHQILLHDIRTRCCQKIAKFDDLIFVVENEIQESVERVHEIVEEMQQSMPYDFNENTQDEVYYQPVSLTSKKLTEHLTYSYVRALRCCSRNLTLTNPSHPLLVCSMIKCLPEKKHAAIDSARQACAYASGINEPIRTFPVCFATYRRRS